MPKRMASTPRTTSDHQIPDTIFESISLSHFLLRLTHVSRNSGLVVGSCACFPSASTPHRFHIGSTSVPSDHCVLAVAAPLRLSVINLRCFVRCFVRSSFFVGG